MKTRIKAIILALTLTIASVPFVGGLNTYGSVEENLDFLSSTNYEKDIEWDLYDDFIRYDLCITDYDALTDEEKELCEFIFVTERSANDTVICERARRQLAGYDVGERVTLDATEKYNEIRDYNYSYSFGINEGLAEQYQSYEEFFDANYYEYHPDVSIFHCVPDIKHIDYYSNINEYWLDDEGNERIFSNGEAEGIVEDSYKEIHGYYKFNEDTQEYDVEYIEKPDVRLSSIEYDGCEYVVLPDNTVALSNLIDKTTAEIIVPESVEGMTVVGIEFKAFADSAVTDVILPDTIEYIAPYAFYNCDSLVNINFPEGLDFIGNRAFTQCGSLGEIILDCPNLITVKLLFSKSDISTLSINTKAITYGINTFNSCDNFIIGENAEKIDAIVLYRFSDIVVETKAIVQQIEEQIPFDEITISSSVEIIGALSPANGWWGGSGVDAPPEIPLIEPNDCLFDSDTVINGYYNTEAHRYAVEWGLKFNPLDEGVAYGDINLDGEISVADAVLLQSKLVGKDVTVGYEADLAKDGIIDIFDMIEMRSKLISNK